MQRGKGERDVSLTVKDILEKTFNRAFKGYNEDEVDQFLDQIIDELKALQSENAALKKSLSAAREKEKKIKETEDAIMNTLVSAQKSSERILKEAARKAELVIASAENTAIKRAEKATKDLADAEERLEDVKRSAHKYAKNFANMINEQVRAFDKAYYTYFGQDEAPVGNGINADALQRIDKDVKTSLEGIEEPSADDIEEKRFKPAKVEQPTSANIDTDQQKPNEEKQNENDVSAEKETRRGLMELHEINKALSDIEQDDDIQETAADNKMAEGDYKPKYDDYSWLYETDNKDDGDFELSFKDPHEKQQLKSLIDEVMD